MCGIAGIVHFDRSPVDARLLRQMVEIIRHRGPDAAGVHLDEGVGLGHARLSIIDPVGGLQPMSTDDGALTITFNGEIFNYVELRRELIGRGRRFATQSDTEVILHAYREWGDECVQWFNGQWALAIYDNRRRRLFLSRDRLGIRPLYYTTAGGKFLFASEVKSLLLHAEVPRAIDPVGLDQVCTFWAPIAPRTVFEGIGELPPGCNLVLEGSHLCRRRYWQLDYDVGLPYRSSDEWAEQVRELLHDATRLRLRSDVPVGAYLSGGLDSSITTALIRRCTDAPLRTFSITFDEAEFDESRYQREVVHRLGTDHAEIHCRAADIGRMFPSCVWHAERPVLRTAPVPLYMLSGLVARAGYRVVLTGEGADEVFGGYDLFKEAKVRRFWARQPDSAWRAALLSKLYPYLPNMQAQPPAYRQAFFRARPEDLGDPMFSHLPRWELTSRLKRFFAPEFRQRLAGHDAYEDCRAMLPSDYERWPPLCQAQFLETSLLMPGYILASQGDRMAAAHGVEGRFPFLDHRLVELASRIPPRLKMRGLREKHILKRATQDLVPPEVVRRTKQPYRAPEAASFLQPDGRGTCSDWVEELLAEKRLAHDGVFQPGAVRQLVDKIRSGRAIGVKDNMALVGILSTQLLIEQFVNNFSGRRPASMESEDPGLAVPTPVCIPRPGDKPPLDPLQGNPLP